MEAKKTIDLEVTELASVGNGISKLLSQFLILWITQITQKNMNLEGNSNAIIRDSKNMDLNGYFWISGLYIRVMTETEKFMMYQVLEAWMFCPTGRLTNQNLIFYLQVLCSENQFK